MTDALGDQVEAVLTTVIDPELGIDVVSLGLIYEIVAGDDGLVRVLMTLTTPGCPMHDTIRHDVELVIRQLPWVADVKGRANLFAALDARAIVAAGARTPRRLDWHGNATVETTTRHGEK